MKDTPKSASTVRYEAEAKASAYSMLSQKPDMQPEAIARHYVCHATAALNLLRMIEMKHQTGGSPDLDQVIQLITDQIKTNHLYSFGIDLNWTKPL